MNKASNKPIISIAFSLVIIAVLAVGLGLPSSANAGVCVSGTPNCSAYYDSYSNGYYNPNIYYNNGYYNNYNYPPLNPTPTIYSVSPNSVNYGTRGVVVGITGSQFAPGAVARFNGADRVTTYSNSSYVQMALTDLDTAYAGTFTISVYNPGGGMVSNVVTFTVNNTVAYNPVPYNYNVVTPPVNTQTTYIYRTVNAPAVATTTQPANVTPAQVQPVATTNNQPTYNTNNGLSANALSSTRSFLPTNVIQWLVFFIFVLIAVIIFRKLFINDTTPMKHH